jgi:hypothetical protein
MLKRFLKKVPIVIAVAAFPLAFAAPSDGQGFRGPFYKGSQKMEVALKRKHPPKIQIMGLAIGVRAKSHNPVQAAYAQQLASELESELCGNDRRLRPENDRPETVVSCNITQLDSIEKWEIHKSEERHKTGERLEWNEKKKKNETKPIYEDVVVSHNFKFVSGAMNVSYQVQDTKSLAILDSDNIAARRDRKPYLDGNGSPSQDEIRREMVKDIVREIVRRLTPTIESVTVMLARGKLDDAGRFGQADLWDKMLELLEDKMQPFKDPKDDAYRIYDIGLAYEALAYKAEDLAVAKKLLQSAWDNYRKALEMNPGEKYFREPQIRIEDAVNQYSRLKTQAEEARPRGLGRPGVQQSDIPEANGSNGLTSTAAKPLTNRDVVDLAKKGMDEANLIATIRDAPAVEFDLRAAALGVLLESGVSNKVIASMRARRDLQRTKKRSGRTGKKPIRNTTWPLGL